MRRLSLQLDAQTDFDASFHRAGTVGGRQCLPHFLAEAIA